MIDVTSDTWRDVSQQAKAKLAEARKELEQSDTTPERTHYLRGQISILINVLALAQPVKPPPVPQRADDFGMRNEGVAF